MDDKTILTKEQIAEIRARAEAATKGPWMAAGRYLTNRDPDGPSFRMSAYHIDELGEEPDGRFASVTLGRSQDAEFIAHARTDVPALLAEVERLREEADRACTACGSTEACEHTDTNTARLAERERQTVRYRALAALVARIIRYAREDQARTPGSTRLARALAEAERMIAPDVGVPR